MTLDVLPDVRLEEDERRAAVSDVQIHNKVAKFVILGRLICVATSFKFLICLYVRKMFCNFYAFLVFIM